MSMQFSFLLKIMSMQFSFLLASIEIWKESIDLVSVKMLCFADFHFLGLLYLKKYVEHKKNPSVTRRCEKKLWLAYSFSLRHLECLLSQLDAPHTQISEIEGSKGTPNRKVF
jgi:hypothetical protein